MNSYQDLLVNSITVISTAESTSSSTGSVIVKGGVGIKGNLYVGGNIICNNVGNNVCNNVDNNVCNNAGNNVNDLTAVNTHIIPCTTNTYDIGNNCKIWRNIYSECINTNSFEKSLIPKIDSTLDIGSDCNKWKNLFLSANATIPNLLTSTIQGINNGSIAISNDVCLTGNLVVTGTITSNGENCIQNNCQNNLNANEINYDLIPSCTNTFNIGSSSNKWKNIYLSEQFHLGINNDFVHMNSLDKLITINGSGTNNSLYGNMMKLTYTGCSNNNANLIRLNHISGQSYGTKIQFEIDNVTSCNIGVNYVNSKHTYIIAPNDGNTCTNTVLINSTDTNINNTVTISESLNVGNSIKYDNNLVHSYELTNIVNNNVDTTKTFSEFTIDEEYKELNFVYDKCTLQDGHIKYFIVTENNMTNCQCNGSPHYKILVDDLIGGTAIILSGIGQSVGLVWTSKNKWMCFSGIACIIT